MPAQVVNHKCPACTGPLHFDSGIGKLKCEYCESVYTVEEIEALYKKQEARAQEAFVISESETRTQQELKYEDWGTDADVGQWDTSAMSQRWDDEDAQMCSYNCPSCGAQLLCDKTTAATSCPYCGNPTIVPGQFSGELKPELVIPFKKDKQAAIDALKQHYKGKFLLPKAFTDANHIQQIQGVYVPFWLYDAKADGHCYYHATKVHTQRRGDWIVTSTEHFNVQRAGSLSFQGVPADGSTKMPDDYMDSIEPFDYRELQPFSTAYLPGYLADRYDVSAQDNAQRADERCKASMEDYLRQDVVGYTSVTAQHTNLRLHRGRVQYALLPVWTLATKWNGKDYLFIMNGQTGKLVGDLPIDQKKLWLTFFTVMVAVSLLFIVTGLGVGIVEMFLS